MTRRRWSWRALAVVAGLALALGGLAACGDDEEGGGGGEQVTLRLGYVTTPQHPYGVAVDFFARRVGELSNGRITIETLPNYGGDIPLLNDTKGGAVDMSAVSSAVWDTQGVNSFQALQAPFLITNYQLELQVIGGDIGRQMLEGTQELGLVGLGLLEGGLRKPLGAKKALVRPADFRGLKIRAVESQVLATGLRALGADPTPLPVTEVYNALRSGTVDAMEANYGLIYTNKYYEVARFVTGNVNFWPFPAVISMNQDRFNGLSQEDQEILRQAGSEVAEYSINTSFLNPPPDAPNFVQLLCEAGLKIATATPADLQALSRAVEPAIQRLSRDEQTGGFIEQIRELKEQQGELPAPPPLPAGCAA